MLISELISSLEEIKNNLGDKHIFIENIENHDFIRHKDYEYAEVSCVFYAKNMYPTILTNSNNPKCVDGVCLAFSSATKKGFERIEKYNADK